LLLLDTDIFIDIFRGYGPALRWLQSLGEEEIAIPGFVAMELLDGCENSTETRRLLENLSGVRIFWPSGESCDSALTTFSKVKLSHRISIFDALIGYCALGLNLPLYTFNQKHFKAIPGLKTIQPYSKSRS